MLALRLEKQPEQKKTDIQTVISKGKLYFEIIFLFSFLAIVSGIMQQQKNETLNKGKIEKVESGEGSRKEKVELYVKDYDQSKKVSINIPEKTLTQEELTQIFKTAKKEAEKKFLNKNTSLDEIRSSVKLPKSLLNDLVECKWNIEENSLISFDGKLKKDKIPKQGKILNASVTLVCQKQECIYNFSFCVKQPIYSKIDQVSNKVKEKIKKQKKEKSYIQLPAKINGHKLKWSYPKQHTQVLLLMLGAFICVMLYLRVYEETTQKEKARSRELNYYYAEIVSKMCLFLGAGMTTRMIWEKMSLTYLKQRQKNEIATIAVYEEMLLTYNQMQEGLSEIEAYQEFAIRCKETKYKKLVSLIIQNIQKGQQEMIALLEQETDVAFSERKLYAKKKGEEASTKLLLPMMIMLFIVIAILIIPAIFAFQI